jgi:hypothetical protein
MLELWHSNSTVYVEHARCNTICYGIGRIILKTGCTTVAVGVARKLYESTERIISRIANIGDALSVAPIYSHSSNVNISRPAIAMSLLYKRASSSRSALS